MTMSIVRLRLFWALQLLKIRQCLYKRVNRFIHDEKNVDYGFQFQHAEVLITKISKVGYVFTDPLKILYVAELIEFFKR